VRPIAEHDMEKSFVIQRGHCLDHGFTPVETSDYHGSKQTPPPRLLSAPCLHLRKSASIYGSKQSPQLPRLVDHIAVASVPGLIATKEACYPQIT
jgi:hypothetical protein